MATSALPLGLLIEINSTGVKDTFTLGKLPTLLIIKDSEVPVEQFTNYTNLTALKAAFRSGAAVDFATEYFGWTSKNATKADYLNVYNMTTTAQGAKLKGAKAPQVDVLKALNGGFNITIDGKANDISVDFSAITDMTTAAAAIKTALNAKTGTGFKSADVTYDSISGGFIITSGTTGVDSTITCISAPKSGDDISGQIGLSEFEGAVAIGGSAAQTLGDVLTAIENANVNAYVIVPNFELTQDELLEFAKWLNVSAGRYCGIYSDKALKTMDTTTLQAYNGLILDYNVADNQSAVVAAYISALDLTKANSNNNIAFNDMSQFATKAVTDRTLYESLATRRVNAPCKFGILGQNDTIYMSGKICGTLTNSINVYLGDSFLNFQTQVSLYNMLKSSKIIGLRDSQSHNAINGYITEVFEDCAAAGLIARGAELTTTEKSVISQTLNGLVDDIDSVYEQLSKYGYYFIVTDIDVTKRELTITRIYVANTPLDKLVIANYILGA